MRPTPLHQGDVTKSHKSMCVTSMLKYSSKLFRLCCQYPGQQRVKALTCDKLVRKQASSTQFQLDCPLWVTSRTIATTASRRPWYFLRRFHRTSGLYSTISSNRSAESQHSSRRFLNRPARSSAQAAFMSARSLNSTSTKNVFQSLGLSPSLCFLLQHQSG